MGRGRVLLETRLQDFHTVVEVSEVGQVLLHREQIRLDRGRGLLPILARKGKGPGSAIGHRGLIHSVSKLMEKDATVAFLIGEKRDDVQWKMPRKARVRPPSYTNVSERHRGESCECCTECTPVIAYEKYWQTDLMMDDEIEIED